MEMLIINIKYIAANELNSLISLVLILNIMKVHRIITTIEVENDNSITSIELINLRPTNADIPLAITNLTTNGNANDINKVYAVVDKLRIVISGELKSIVYSLNNCLNCYKCN